MKVLLLAALLPGLYWDKGPETAAAVKQTGLQRLYVPAGSEEAWKKEGFAVVTVDPARQGFVQAPPPGIEYRPNVASATNSPWIDSNAWRFQRDGSRTFFYKAPAGKAVLAAAEAYAFGVDAVVEAVPADLEAFGRMNAFLRKIDRPRLPGLANVGVIDDGSEAMGEVMNLLTRRNLLYRVVLSPDAKYAVNVKPTDDVADPDEVARRARQKVGDDKRLVRLYGSDVVIARLTGDNTRRRLHLLNYSGRRVNGLRVRILGAFPEQDLAVFGVENAALADVRVADGATEFTLPEMQVYAVVDLTR